MPAILALKKLRHKIGVSVRIRQVLTTILGQPKLQKEITSEEKKKREEEEERWAYSDMQGFTSF